MKALAFLEATGFHGIKEISRAGDAGRATLDLDVSHGVAAVAAAQEFEEAEARSIGALDLKYRPHRVSWAMQWFDAPELVHG